MTEPPYDLWQQCHSQTPRLTVGVLQAILEGKDPEMPIRVGPEGTEGDVENVCIDTPDPLWPYTREPTIMISCPRTYPDSY